MRKSIKLQRANLTGIAAFLNNNFKKKSGKPFTPRDVLGYVKRRKLPSYIGDGKVTLVTQYNCSIKLYNIEIKGDEDKQ